MNASTLQERYQQIRERMLAQRADATLVAVSKTRTTVEIAALAELGQRDFGENYAQEGVAKITALRAQFPQLRWHFIGPLQSNKTRLVAEHFDWVHTIERGKIAERLAAQRPPGLPALQVCLEVNIGEQESKSGVSLSQLDALAAEVMRYPQLCLRGLMCIPAPGREQAASQFARMNQAWRTLQLTCPSVDTLSMGMSDDFDIALAHGATLIRIGTAIFGPRPAPA